MEGAGGILLVPYAWTCTDDLQRRYRTMLEPVFEAKDYVELGGWIALAK